MFYRSYTINILYIFFGRALASIQIDPDVEAYMKRVFGDLEIDEDAEDYLMLV